MAELKLILDNGHQRRLNDPGQEVDEENRRYSQLAFLLRSHTLMDIDCFSRVPGRPFMPCEVHDVIIKEMAKMGKHPKNATAAKEAELDEAAISSSV